MENHPIPQDITGFQFKLIGDMTIKQFAYLATGVVSGWIIFSLPITLFIKLPITTIFVLLGVGFAFFSIQGRPMDLMIMNFIRALFSPSQFVYQRTTHVRIETPKAQLFSNQLDATPPPTTHEQPQLQPAPTTPLEEPLEEKKFEELKEEEEKLAEELKKAKTEEEKEAGTSASVDAHQKTLELEKLLSETVLQKQKLEEELLALRRQLEESGKQVFKVPQLQESQTVRSVPPGFGKTVGLPIVSEYPNVISGIIKDPRGNPLQNILVEVKDKEGNPVRAFKTNPLGQFTASTPLTNGVYRIEFEDPQSKNKFEVIEFEAKGDIIYPLEIVSIDMREELRKSLFK